MIAFALVATAMVAVAVAWILVPLLRRRDAGDVDRGASNVAILRDQFAELDADLARGTISPANHEQARRELERRVLEEVSESPGAASRERGTPWAAAVLAGLVPVVAVLLYLVIGTPDTVIRQITRVKEMVGITHFNCSFWFGDLEHPRIMKSMTLFANEVLPAFR